MPGYPMAQYAVVEFTAMYDGRWPSESRLHEAFEWERRENSKLVDYVTRFLGEDGILVDVGANIGVFQVLISERCYACKVYAFEAIPYYAAYASRKSAGNPNIVVFNAAVGDSAGPVTISMDPGTNIGWNTFVGEKKTQGMLDVNTVSVTLDQFFERCSIGDIQVLKIDTEGYEWHVLDGVRKSLERMAKKPVLLIEIGWGTTENSREDWRDEVRVFEWLFTNGYKRIPEFDKIVGTTDVVVVPLHVSDMDSHIIH